LILQQIIDGLDQIAPPRLAEEWDNVGLLVGDPQQHVSRAILTIDYTPAVAHEAHQAKCELVIAYHPPIFAPLKRIVGPSLIHDALRNGLAIYSPHTALDVAEGGTNDMLADAIGLVERRPLRLTQPKPSQYKLVTFVPQKDVERVSHALFAAGAGWIGNYSSCSFRSEGTGTFFGQEGTHPAVGSAGKLEQAPELRLEMVVPIARADAAVAAIRQAHPYEEPAFDLVQLAPAPFAAGQGRIGTMPVTPRPVVIDRIKKELGLTNLLVAGPLTGTITKAAACAGSCGDILADALAAKAELYLTGEMRHHDALRAAEAGMTVVCTLHSNSERAVLKRLAARLATQVPGLKTRLSEADRDPFTLT
jgi:dinuclear metal center YbgI/SA1388 family protein